MTTHFSYSPLKEEDYCHVSVRENEDGSKPVTKVSIISTRTTLGLQLAGSSQTNLAANSHYIC